MSFDLNTLPGAWRRAMQIARAGIGVACLTVQLLTPAQRGNAITIFTAVFAAYTLLAPFWKVLERAIPAMVSLLFETAFFLAFATYGVDQTGWLSSLLYLYLLLTASLRHDWGEVFIVAAGSIVYFEIIQGSAVVQLRRIVCIAGILACAMALQKKKMFEQLSESADRELRLKEDVVKARETERQKIMGDFHDGPLQSFIGLQVRLDILKRVFLRDPASALKELDDIQELTKNQVAEIRSFLRNTKPPDVEGTELMLWMRRVVEEFQKDTGLPTRFSSTEAELTAPPEVTREVLQILREALHNVQKHSQAARVAVSVERIGKTLEISVEDNGSGFSFSGSFTLEELELLRLGPQSIKRRVRSLGGELMLESRPGQGSGLRIRIPA